MQPKRIAIIGAGPAGLACAERLSEVAGLEIVIYEQMPTAARKFLMAGKTGLNISHNQDLETFIAQYDQPQQLAQMIRHYSAAEIRNWMHSLGIQSYVGSSGRIFPEEMKAAPLLRAWIARLQARKVQFFYRHQLLQLEQRHLTLLNRLSQQQHTATFDAVVLACGAVSWPQLGSDGAWQAWLNPAQLKPFVASNVGVQCSWSEYMQPFFGQPLKRIKAWVAGQSPQNGEMVISHYGLEGGLVYRCNRGIRTELASHGVSTLYLDLLPDLDAAQLHARLPAKHKQSLNNKWQKLGLDKTKIALLRELVDPAFWHDDRLMLGHIKALAVPIAALQPIEQAISCAGGLRWSAMDDYLALRDQAGVFACGEMLDWDAPTGGYLLTACLATGRHAALGVLEYLALPVTAC